jgi:hypothetical protein
LGPTFILGKRGKLACGISHLISRYLSHKKNKKEKKEERSRKSLKSPRKERGGFNK